MVRDIPQPVVLALLWLTASCQNTPLEKLPPLPSVKYGEAADAGVVVRRPDAGPAEIAITLVTPTGDAVLKRASAPEVRARVVSEVPGTDRPSTDPIDPTSVTLVLRRLQDRGLVVTAPLFGPMANGEFSGRMDLSSAETGEYLLGVAASTRSGRRGSAVIPVKVDAGPRITIVSPRANGAYKGSVAVQVQIDASPFLPAQEPIEAVLGQTPVPLSRAAPDSIVWEGLIELGKFEPPLVGDQALRVSAANAQGTRAEAHVRFVVDERGPVFESTEPADGSVVGGVITLRARLRDSAGVLGPSVMAVIGNKADALFKVQLVPDASEPGVWSALFDTTKLTVCKPAPDQSLCIVRPSLSFRAADRLGNEANVAYEIAVDNHPPVADLDPPEMRIWTFDRDARKEICSWAFDPLGPYRRLGDMPNDGCAVPQLFDLRARIEDRGNRGDGLKIEPIAEVDPRTAGVFVLHDTAQPLVVDMDGDGVCDVINPKLAPTTSPPASSNEVLLLRLAAVAPKGSADFTADPTLLTAAGMNAWPGCNPGTAPQSPGPLCATQAVSLAVGYWTAKGPLSAIWTVEPVENAGLYCLGSQLDTHANQIPDRRWVCIAAAASDRNGNQGVSRPLRVWLQQRGLPQGGPTCPLPPPAAGPAPDCSGTYNRQTGEVSNRPCMGRRFPAGELRPAGD
jgi:hypothetical protein